MITRSEKLVFALELDKTKADQHKADLLVLKRDTPDIYEGDLLKFEWSLYLNYLDDIDKSLQALERIISDPEVVRRVSTKELNHGCCLFEDIVTRINKLKGLV
jgi:hypothetical protein